MNSAAILPESVSGEKCVWIRRLVVWAAAGSAAPIAKATAAVGATRFFNSFMFFLPRKLDRRVCGVQACFARFGLTKLASREKPDK